MAIIIQIRTHSVRLFVFIFTVEKRERKKKCTYNRHFHENIGAYAAYIYCRHGY